jgi:hypothetical protein
MYDSGRYFTVTGHRVEGTPATIEDRHEQLQRLHDDLFAPTKPSTPPPPRSTGMLEDHALLERACAASNGDKFRGLWNGDSGPYNGDESAADLALCDVLAFWCSGDAVRIDSLFRQSGLMRGKWDERRGEQTYGQRTIRKALEGRTEYYRGPGSGTTRAKRTSGESEPWQGNEDVGEPAFRWSNYLEEEMSNGDGKPHTVRVGLPLATIAKDLHHLVGDWPKRIGDLLFVQGKDHRPLLLPSPDRLFAWVGGVLRQEQQANPIVWASGADKVSQAPIYCLLAADRRRLRRRCTVSAFSSDRTPLLFTPESRRRRQQGARLAARTFRAGHRCRL